MADSSQYNLSLVITANNKAVEELNKIWKSVDNVKWNITQLSESTKKTLKTVGITATAITWSVVALWKSFVDSAMEIEPLRRSFDRLSKSVWVASDEMLEAMRNASKWTVSDLKLMEAANTAYSLWVVKSTDEMTTLMEIARVKWQAMWRSMEEALDDIVRWLWRSSPLILDNLWISVKLSDAYAEYATQLWKTADAMTEAEKKQALINYVVSRWKQELEEAWEVQLTMAEKLRQLNTQRDNMKVVVGEALIPVIQKVLEVITPMLDKIVARVNEHPDLTANILLTVWAVSWLVAILSWLALALPWITTAISILTSNFWLLWTAVWVVEIWLNKLEEKIVSTDEKVEMYNKAIEDLQWQFERWEISQQQFTMAVQEYNGKIEQAYADSQTLWQYLKDQLDDTLKVMTFDTERRSQARQDFGTIFQAVWDMFDKFTVFLINEANVAIDWLWIAINAVSWFFDNLTASVMNFVSQWVNRAIEKVWTLTTKLKNMLELVKEVSSSVSSKLWSAGNSIKSGLSNLFWKAWWWTVYAWTPYIVWENWPELFVPSQRWSITPNNQITNNNWIEINMNWFVVRSEQDANTIAKEVIRLIKLEKNFGIA